MGKKNTKLYDMELSIPSLRSVHYKEARLLLENTTFTGQVGSLQVTTYYMFSTSM